MASTSNKNTPGNYHHEQTENRLNCEHITYLNSGAGEAYTNHFAGDGLLSGKNARSKLCNNYCDIESQLRGIGSTNLVNPYKTIEPQLRPMQSLSIMQKLPVLIPEPLVIEKNQRPYMN
jgi:hypothetical protein